MSDEKDNQPCSFCDKARSEVLSMVERQDGEGPEEDGPQIAPGFHLETVAPGVQTLRADEPYADGQDASEPVELLREVVRNEDGCPCFGTCCDDPDVHHPTCDHDDDAAECECA